jgi:hypothetical protein
MKLKLVIGGLALILASGCGKKDDDARATNTTSGSATPATVAPLAPATQGVSAAKIGLKAGEEIVSACDTVSIDGECADLACDDPAKRAESVSAMKALCTKGKFGGTCPTSGVVGHCRVMRDFVVRYYAHGGKNYDATTAKAACEKDHGRWVQ